MNYLLAEFEFGLLYQETRYQLINYNGADQSVIDNITASKRLRTVNEVQLVHNLHAVFARFIILEFNIPVYRHCDCAINSRGTRMYWSLTFIIYHGCVVFNKANCGGNVSHCSTVMVVNPHRFVVVRTQWDNFRSTLQYMLKLGGNNPYMVSSDEFGPMGIAVTTGFPKMVIHIVSGT